jgi:hypothetical protein
MKEIIEVETKTGIKTFEYIEYPKSDIRGSKIAEVIYKGKSLGVSEVRGYTPQPSKKQMIELAIYKIKIEECENYSE